MRHRLHPFLLAASLGLSQPAHAQVGMAAPDPPTNQGINQGRFIGVVVGTAAVYALTTYF